ncbi:MAG: uracil-DNA glycosylase [Burkholderiaceae bacterium]
MALDLDDRQRAMLKQMGIRVWLPRADAEAPAPVATLAPLAPLVPLAPPAPQAQHARSEVAAGPAPLVRPAAPSSAALAARPAGVEAMDWSALRTAVAGCEACKLCSTRRNTVFGVGAERADWMVVGEAPGENEDLQGEPFVGQAGKLLDNMLRAVGLSRAGSADGTDSAVAGANGGVFIANVLKCRPPGNRNPQPDEIAQCEPFLKRQVALVQPKVILAMGRFAVQSLLQSDEPIGKLRGRVHQYEGVPLVVTYHPAYLLRNLPDKAKAWADLCLARATLNARQ